jgi:transposase
MLRLMLTNEFWSKLEPILLQEGIHDKPNLRNTVEAILYRMRVGCPWRDLPAEFGRWNAIYKRFNYWASKNIFMRVFNLLNKDSDGEWHFIDGSYIRAHQHSTGAASPENQAIEKSRGGNTTKIHMVVDAYGLPVNFSITAGNINDVTAAPDLINSTENIKIMVGDKGYDSELIRKTIENKGGRSIIPRKSNSIIGNNDVDWYLYKLRHLVENIFARLKHFRAIATRYDKLERNFYNLVGLACSFLWLPM